MAAATASALDWVRAWADVQAALRARRLGLDWRPDTLAGRPCFSAVLPLPPDWPTVRVVYGPAWACLLSAPGPDGRARETAITLPGGPDEAAVVLRRVERRVAQDLLPAPPRPGAEHTDRLVRP